MGEEAGNVGRWVRRVVRRVVRRGWVRRLAMWGGG